MKKIMLVFLVFVLVNSLFADPFGLKMGGTLDEIQAKCGGKEPKYTGGGVMYDIEPIKKNDQFTRYTVFVHDDFGLYAIAAETAPEDHGNCKAKLRMLSLMLGVYYGEEEVKNEKDGYSWFSNRYSKLKKEKLSGVMLSIIPADGKKEQCFLLYCFENFEEAQDSTGGPF